jgi:hypothetical protein
MEFRIWVEVRLAGRVLDRRVVAQVEREATGIGPEEIGLTLEEGKTVLSQVQAGVVHQQVEALQAAHWKCLKCGSKQRIKDRRRRCLRTIFGVVRVSCRRYLRCRCQGGKRVTVWPLHGRQASGTTPELQYLYADWGSKVPYRRAATVLQELLPGRVSHATLRRHTLKVGARLQERVIEPSEYDWPEPRREPAPASKSLSVAIDGTYVRADGAMWLREYQVVAGRMERQGKLGDYFAWVPRHRLCIEKDFMKAALEDNGWRPESQVRVLADGADGVGNLIGTATGKPTERVLDWFHISMRLRPIEQMSAKMAMAVGDSDAELKQLFTEKAPRIRYQLWHGKREPALERIEHIYSVAKRLEASGSVADAERIGRFRQHLNDLRDYLRNNWNGLRNYGAERRQGRKISSALAESAMSHLVNQRMGKRQPMCWSAEGAHLLLQVRCAVLNNRLDNLFREWHPDFRRQRAVPVPISDRPHV